MDSFEYTKELIKGIEKEIPNTYSSDKKKRIISTLSDSVFSCLNKLKKESKLQTEEEIKTFCDIYVQFHYNYSIKVFNLKEIDKYYEDIMSSISRALYNSLVDSITKKLDKKELFLQVEYDTTKMYSKLVKEYGHIFVEQIKDSDIVRNSAYFWQLVFVKYLNNNQRVFYPNFFSNGFIIESEKQFHNYIKFGNKFFIILGLIIVLLAKFKILKALLYFNLLSIKCLGIILLVCSIIGIIYNAVVSKVIFKDSEIIKEKFWENNKDTVTFLRKLITEYLLVFIALIAVFCVGVKTPDSTVGITMTVGSLLALIIYTIIRKSYVVSFVSRKEKIAIKIFTDNELQVLDEKRKYIVNMYLNDYVEYMRKVSNFDYIAITKKIRFFIRHFNRFYDRLIALGIDEKEFDEIIQDRFLTHFVYV